GLADGNVGFSAPRDRDDAWAMRRAWMTAAGLDPEALAVGSQRHGSGVAVVGRDQAGLGARPDSASVGIADGLVTNEPGVVLMTLHADCMPLMLADPVRRVVATVHAGWRGTVADIAGETVRTMRETYGSDPRDLVAYLGPAIGVCCYEVGDDVHAAWSDRAGSLSDEAVPPSGEKWRFDLERANRQLLQRAGLIEEHIERSGICTKCRGDEWFSHRGQGAATGRYAAFIAVVSP
ncbi:MAG: peptidoglycan editing factor PgeF, partial [Thermomicrobiales bacterium]|nr:peptidoglycan editing factor PgeF [Thermomicrobiales bacterium]